MANRVHIKPLTRDTARMLRDVLAAICEEAEIKMIHDPSCSTYPDLDKDCIKELRQVADDINNGVGRSTS